MLNERDHEIEIRQKAGEDVAGERMLIDTITLGGAARDYDLMNAMAVIDVVCQILIERQDLTASAPLIEEFGVLLLRIEKVSRLLNLYASDTAAPTILNVDGFQFIDLDALEKKNAAEAASNLAQASGLQAPVADVVALRESLDAAEFRPPAALSVMDISAPMKAGELPKDQPQNAVPALPVPGRSGPDGEGARLAGETAGQVERFTDTAQARLTLDMWQVTQGSQMNGSTRELLARVLFSNRNFKEGRWFIDVQTADGRSVIAYLSGSLRRDASGRIEGGTVQIYSPEDRGKADAAPILQMALPEDLFVPIVEEKAAIKAIPVADKVSEVSAKAMSSDRFAMRLFEERLRQISSENIKRFEPMVLVSYLDHLDAQGDEAQIGKAELSQQLASMARIKQILEARAKEQPEVAQQIRDLVKFEFRDGQNRVRAEWSDRQTDTVKRRMVVGPYDPARLVIGQGFFGTADARRTAEGFNFVPILSTHIAAIMIQWESDPERPADSLTQLLGRLLQGEVPASAVRQFKDVADKNEQTLNFYSKFIVRAIERLQMAQYIRVAEMVMKAVGAAA